MVISILGQTDKRPVLYTLMKLAQTLGDCCVVTSDVRATRLIDGAKYGHYQNIFMAVTTATQDEIFSEIHYTKEDFEFFIFDCRDQIPDYSDLVIYVGGAGKMTEDEETLLDMFGEYKTINLGFGDKCIPYSVDMFKFVEQAEGLKHLGPAPSQIASRLATFLTEPLKIPAKDIVKVVTSK